MKPRASFAKQLSTLRCPRPPPEKDENNKEGARLSVVAAERRGTAGYASGAARPPGVSPRAFKLRPPK